MLKFGSLKTLVESKGIKAACQILEAASKNGDIQDDDWSIQELAHVFLGADWERKYNMMMDQGGGFQISESTQVGTSVTAFSNITGQLIFNIIHSGWTHSSLIGTMVSQKVLTKFEKETIPGISTPPVPEGGIGEGQEYPHAGLSEHFWDTPKTIKEGLIIPITKEAIMFDRTGIIVNRAREVGETLAITKEERILNGVLGITNTHIFDGTGVNTYLSAGIFINLLAATPLVDHTDIDAARQLLSLMTHPDTGKPLLIGKFDILTMPTLNFTARRIVNATEVRQSAGGQETLSSNPLPSMGVMESSLARQLLVASGLSTTISDGRWYIGDFKKAFAWFQNWDITVVTAPQNSEPEFTRDIQLRYKASFKGELVVLEPRAVVQVNAA
jgi:hypothetical protein